MAQVGQRRHPPRAQGVLLRIRTALPVIGLVASGVPTATAMAAKEKIQGICYGPFPAKADESAQVATQLIDDYMSDAAKPLWGPRGRGDLGIMRQLGANTVRLYGNDPREMHDSFLDEAYDLGLGVIPGISDFPYMQAEDSCLKTNFNCYSQVRASYLQNLQNGWLKDGGYHPALRHVIAINEPDLKLKSAGEQMSPQSFGKGIISAIDGILDAEKEANLTRNLINFTATFSFALCLACRVPQQGGGKPALNQMLELRNAMLHPDQYGYQPRNNLTYFYEARFINSFNTQNPSHELQSLFFETYASEFPAVPVAIEEFHSTRADLDQAQDLQNVLSMLHESDLILGVSFFEYQVRYDKGGSEKAFGLFALGGFQITTVTYYGRTYNVWCLESVEDAVTGRPLAAELAEALGGPGVDLERLCLPDPRKVKLNERGFQEVRRQGSAAQMAVFLTRVVGHFGAVVASQQRLDSFAGRALTFERFGDVVAALEARPTWVSWDEGAACIADRHSDRSTVGQAVADVCLRTWFNCENIPVECKSSVWDAADYVFSVYYNQELGPPLTSCYLNRTAVFAPVGLSSAPRSKQCVVTKDPRTTPITDEGYQAIALQNSSASSAIFVRRVIRDRLHARVLDDSALASFASGWLPASMYDLTEILLGARWVCAGETGRSCVVAKDKCPDGGCTATTTTALPVVSDESLNETNPGNETKLGKPDEEPPLFMPKWWTSAFAGLGMMVLLAMVCTVAYVQVSEKRVKHNPSREWPQQSASEGLP